MERLPGWFDEFEQTLNISYHSGGVVEVPDGYSTGWRTLPYTCCAQTTYTSLIMLDDEQIELEPGTACVIKQGVRHRIDKTSIGFGISRFVHIIFRIFGCIDALAVFDVATAHRAGVADRMGNLCAGMAAASTDAVIGPHQAITRKALGFELLRTIAEASPMRARESSDLQCVERLRPVYEHIHACLAETITLARLARIARLSPSRFHAVFKSMSGEAPLRFIKRQRIMKAQQLLIETDAPIKDIAAQVGHSDEFHFSRTFKAHSGTSPSTYRHLSRSTVMGGPFR